MKNRSTDRLGRLFLNAVPLESRSPGSVVMKKRSTTDAGTLRAAQPSSMTLCNERRSGFTLIELLVVVLIIGILSAIALPQYQMAVTKSRVATMLPLMRRWYDAMAMCKIENGYYCSTSAELGVSWPSDFSCSVHGLECWNDQWSCFANEEGGGEVYCHMEWLKKTAYIQMSQPDDPNYPPGKRFCGDNEKVCKALGGKEIPGYPGYYEL